MISLLSAHGSAGSARQSMDRENLFTAMIIVMFIAGVTMGLMLNG
jgi:hypothetical protein